MRTPALYAVLLAGLPCSARAEPVLHERVFLGASSGQRCKNGVCTSGAEVSAIEQDGRLLQAPSDGPQPLPDEQVFAPEPERAPAPPPGGPPLPGDPPPERRPMVRMDRETGPEGAIAHSYHAVFTPSVFPYKRMSALDWANEEEMLTVFDVQREPVQAQGAQARRTDHDAFWGSIVVDLEPGKWVPLPSVAPDARLLEYRTLPPSRPGAIEFSHDGADNFFVRATTTGGAGGRRRLIWLTDARQTYFSGTTPDTPLAEQPPAHVHPLPPRLRKVARGVLDTLGLRPTPRTPLRAVLDPLVEYFRSFDMGKLPPASDSTYRDIALGKHGVCRHRAFAFTVTALAAGIAARYVENELHVFVEVYVPRVGWRRINLGGAALDDRLAGADDKPMHRPRFDDDMPRPPPFEQNATPPDKRAGTGTGKGSGAGAGSGGDGRGGKRIDLGAVLDADATVSTKLPAKVPTTMSIVVDTRVAFRGDTVEVQGQVLERGGGGAADLPIEIYLDGAPGAERVADTRTGPDGRFVVVALVPAGLDPGTYHVVARSPGDAKRNPSSSRGH